MAIKSNTVGHWLMHVALIVAVVNPSGALAKPCLCHIGVRYSSSKLIEYEKSNLQELEFNKKAKCSATCAAKCAADIQDGQKICDHIGSDFTVPTPIRDRGIGCFSLVGTKGGTNDRWDFDGFSTVTGCQRTCTCPGGLPYNRFRKSCVKRVGCDSISGLPDGDIGNGFYVYQSSIFTVVPGAVCTVRPLYESTAYPGPSRGPSSGGGSPGSPGGTGGAALDGGQSAVFAN